MADDFILIFHSRDAFLTSSQEKIVYLPCIIPDKDRPDYLATVDVDPDSPTYSTVCLTCTQPPPTYCRLFRSYLVFTFPTLEMRSTTQGGMLAVLVLMIHQDQEAGRTVLSTWLVFTVAIFRLIVPGLGSDRVYIVDVKTDPLNPKLDKVIEPWEMHAHGVGTPHTTHCLADGNVMISTLSDGPEKNGKGSFILLDGETFKPKGTWPATAADVAPYG